MKKLLIITAFTLIAGATSASADQTGLAGIHELRHEGGRLCMSGHFHDGSGSGATRKAAEAAAIGSWGSFVDLEYGSDWASFGYAGSRKMKCSQSGGTWSCVNEGRPCLHAGRAAKASKKMRTHAVRRAKAKQGK